MEEVGRALLARLGPQHWWPAESAEEMIIGAVLTQAVAWENAARAIARLRAGGLCSLPALARMAPEDLAPRIREAGYYNAKARKLVAVASFFVRRGGLDALRARDRAGARRELLAVHGIGPESADAILCYALGHPAFVADAYARRVLSRIGAMPASAARGYEPAAAWAAAHVAGDCHWLGEIHALLVAVGKDHCRKGEPLCAGCPAAAFCAHGQARGAPREGTPRPRAGRGGPAHSGTARGEAMPGGGNLGQRRQGKPGAAEGEAGRRRPARRRGAGGRSAGATA